MAEEALRPLSDVPAINRFLSYCRVRTIPGKTVMIHAGDLPDVLYYIVDGSVEVMIEDEDGNLCPLAEDLVSFGIAGPARIAAVDNGDAATVEQFRGNSRHAFAGLSLLVLKTQRGRAGRIKVSASAEGLWPTSIELTAV